MVTVTSCNAAIVVLLSACQFVNGFPTAFLQSPKITLTSSSPISTSTNNAFHGSMSLLPKCHTTKNQPFPNLKMSQDDEDDGEEDDDDYEPLRDGVNSISWLPPLATTDSTTITPPSPKITTTSTAESKVLPLFPLGGIVYTPNSEHVLNIFEPRYRQMYNDILMNGSKQFVVAMSHPEVEGTFAKVGVVFQLEDLKEVSEQTGDQIKYVCNHKVVGRVLIHRVLNPEVWDSRETYLRVEGIVIDETDGEEEDEDGDEENDDEDDDEDKDKDGNEPGKDEVISNVAYNTLLSAVKKDENPTPPLSKEERKLKASFKALVDKQHKIEEDIRFTESSVSTLAVAPGGGDDGLWMTVRLWQSFIEQRLVGRQNEMQMEFQKKLIAFLKKEKGLEENELPSAIGFDDLSPALQQEVKDLQKRMQLELKPLVLESTLTIQKVLECDDHSERVNLLRYFVDAEKKRLDAKATLKGMFSGSPDAVAEDFVEKGDDSVGKENVKDEEEGSDPSRNVVEMMNLDADIGDAKGSLFTDEPDAFQ